ncbi:MAG: hypothetical protein L0H37_09895, partial [Nitrosospira sp.]|nr:hypothetical protein [Nitrosospira sp.]
MLIGLRTLLSNCQAALHRRLATGLGWIRASFLGVQLGHNARVSRRANIRGARFLGNVQIGNAVTIGEGTYINSGIVWCGIIGKYCSIGYNVLIGPTEHRLDYWTMSPFEAKDHGERPEDTNRDIPTPVIEDGARISARVIVLRGVRIGCT